MPGTGVDTVLGRIEVCSEPNCADCILDHSKCLRCKSTYYLKADKCVSRFDANLTTEGFCHTTKTLRPCLVPNCINCRDDYSMCKDCDYLRGYLLTESGRCIHKDKQPKRYGASEDLRRSISCKIEGCMDCRKNASSCQSCYTELGLYQYQGLLSCNDTSSLAPGWGLATSGFRAEIKPCTELHCIRCASDYSKCTACNSTQGYVLSNGRCIRRTQLTKSLGFNEREGKITSCSYSPCQDCGDDADVCVSLASWSEENLFDVQSWNYSLTAMTLALGFDKDIVVVKTSQSERHISNDTCLKAHIQDLQYDQVDIRCLPNKNR